MNALHKLDLQPRLLVALATHSGRTQSHVRTFLSGPAREQFVIGDAGRAHVLIADFDNAQSRSQLHDFLVQGRGQAIVLAVSDPGIPGTVWVPKPVRDEDLSVACQVIWNRLLNRLSSPMLPSSIERPALKLIPPPIPPLDTEQSIRHQPPGRALLGAFRDSSQTDWTSSIVWMALGVLFISAVVSVMGWRPAEQNFRPATSKMADEAGADRSIEDLRRAIDLAVKAMPVRPASQQSWVEAELADYLRLSDAPPVTATLVRLALAQDEHDVSRRALPLDLMAEAGALWQAQADVRAALSAATRDVSVVAKRE